MRRRDTTRGLRKKFGRERVTSDRGLAPGRRSTSSLALPFLILVLLAGVVPRVDGRAAVTFHPPNEVEFAATVNTRGFERTFLGMPGYHAIVWKGGRAAGAALLQANVSDVEVLKAMEKLGARPSNNVPMAAWEERKNPRSPAPDTVITGPEVEVWLRLPGRRDLLALSSVLTSTADRGLDMRFGGNAQNIPRWKSGCIVCLFSCPGSKVGNADATIRDYESGKVVYRVRPGVLPSDGTSVGVILRLKSFQ